MRNVHEGNFSSGEDFRCTGWVESPIGVDASPRIGEDGGGCADFVGVVAGEGLASRTPSRVDFYARKIAMAIGHGQLIGLEGRVNLEGQSEINVMQELFFCRESLRFLEVEVDLGLARLDVVINKLEGIGPG